MAKKETEKQDGEFLAVEKLKEINKTPEAVFQGMCAANEWQKGRAVTPKEYWVAQKRFLGAAIGGRK